MKRFFTILGIVAAVAVYVGLAMHNDYNWDTVAFSDSRIRNMALVDMRKAPAQLTCVWQWFKQPVGCMTFMGIPKWIDSDTLFAEKMFVERDADDRVHFSPSFYWFRVSKNQYHRSSSLADCNISPTKLDFTDIKDGSDAESTIGIALFRAGMYSQ